jgi:hypothetical protein
MSRRLLAATLVLTLLSWLGALAQPMPDEQGRPEWPRRGQAPNDHNAIHRCCQPGAFSFPVATHLVPANTPCGGEHSCCIRPGPQGSPNLSSPSGNRRPAAEAVDSLESEKSTRNSRLAFGDSGFATVRPYSALALPSPPSLMEFTGALLTALNRWQKNEFYRRRPTSMRYKVPLSSLPWQHAASAKDAKETAPCCAGKDRQVLREGRQDVGEGLRRQVRPGTRRAVAPATKQDNGEELLRWKAVPHDRTDHAAPGH